MSSLSQTYEFYTSGHASFYVCTQFNFGVKIESHGMYTEKKKVIYLNEKECRQLIGTVDKIKSKWHKYYNYNSISASIEDENRLLAEISKIEKNINIIKNN